ncbi:general secretion pathway protein GspK [Pseudomonas reactans]|uniref:general secretion pathway protein GspK n=1 Tax=Pseudomonas reactans TaxID=117680 RepID=UPI0031B5EB5B
MLSVMLVMSLALLMTAGMLRSHQLMVQSSVHQVHQVQLRQLGWSAEAWAMAILAEDAELAVVHSSQAWARLTWPFDTQPAHIALRVEDLAARFNINTLLGDGQVDQVSRERWSRLLASRGLPPLDLSAAGQVPELQELSQLRVLRGVDGATLRQLEPWVALLPKEAGLNINTAKPEVLAILDGVPLSVAKALVSQRPAAGYASVQDFTHDPLIAGFGVNGHGLSVSSRWFRITADVRLGTSRLRMVCDVERERKTGRWRVVQRRFLPPISSDTAL